MRMRTPAMAGQFYPDSADSCRSFIQQCLAPGAAAELPDGFRPVGGIAPHAGWVCSGAVAAQVVRVLAECGPIDTFVIFGAVHRRLGVAAAVCGQGGWETPLGSVLVDEELAELCVQDLPLIVADAEVHEHEHSIEVEVPFIRHLAPNAKLLPMMIPPTAASPLVGRTVAEAGRRLGRRLAYLGSTDLTHYGPRYHFTPHGAGADGLRWAKEVNDRRIVEMMIAMHEEQVIREAAEHRNACGAGAIAATIAACKFAGATRGHLLNHTNSNEVLRDRYGDMEDAVGYAGIVWGQ